jgi:putative membrane protein insertion efficiency factor
VSREHPPLRSAAQLATLPLILLARFWQVGPSRLIPATCRYSPSCSAYAIAAWRTHGPWRGTLLAAARLLRCHPWGGCGHDPVPPVKDQSARV